MRVNYEEKTFESYFNNELDSCTSVYFPFGQVQEGSIGADSAAFSKNRRLWWWLGYPFIFSLPFGGVEFSEMAGIMEKYIGHEIKNLPNIKTNILFQYKKPEYIASHLGGEWKHWSQPYYRYDIYQKQQLMLEELSQTFKGKALILYASPAINDVDELVKTKQLRKIIKSTNFRPTEELKGHHKNTYIKSGLYSIACSEPEKLESFDLLEHLARLDTNTENTEEQLHEFVKNVVSVIMKTELNRAFVALYEPFVERNIKQYPILNSILQLKLVRDITGLQWCIALKNPLMIYK
jgi:hypothetical protein